MGKQCVKNVYNEQFLRRLACRFATKICLGICLC